MTVWLNGNFIKTLAVFVAASVVVSLACSSVFACDIHGKTGFMPENNLRISKYAKSRNGMTQEKFEAIIKRVFDAYAPIVATKGASLDMINDWDDENVNAMASRDGDIWHVNMYGGLARHPFITDDGFMLIVCHETGHHVGGVPKYASGTDLWASNEGQADYFASLKCMKRVLEKDDNIALVATMQIEAEATRQCQDIYKNADEAALCQRISMAGKSLAEFMDLLGENKNVNFNTPDKQIVKETSDDYPEAQCRLDTYFAGALCDKAFTDDVSETSPISGVCIKKDGYKIGSRPLCWYKPGTEE